MLTFKQDDTVFSVRNTSWILAVLMLPIPPALLYELGPSVIDGSIDKSDLAGLIIGVIGPLAAVYFLFEFSEFRFSNDDGLFRWRWRNLLGRKQGQVPLERVVRVRREGLQNSSGIGQQYVYRLIVILDDDTIIPLSQRYSGINDRLLDKVVKELRGFLGHVERMP